MRAEGGMRNVEVGRMKGPDGRAGAVRAGFAGGRASEALARQKVGFWWKLWILAGI